MNLDEERKKLILATIDALKAAWPVPEADGAYRSIAEIDTPGRHEESGSAIRGMEPRVGGGRAARERVVRNHTSRRA